MAKGKSKAGGIKKYWQQKGKKQAIGSAIDIGGALIGGGIGAALKGKTAFWVGLGTILAGHLIGEKGKIVHSIGVGATAYGIATIDPLGIGTGQPVSGATGMQGVKERLMAFKDNLLHATFLDKLVKKKEATGAGGSIGNIDMSDLDLFEQYGQQQAYLQALLEEQQNDQRILERDDEYEDQDDLEGFDDEYASYEVVPPMEIDWSTI